MYRSTKMWGPFSTAFRQPFADSHCRLVHGYGLRFKATFETHELDPNGWVMDFGGLKPIKAWLDETFDHKLVVSRHDILLPEFEALDRKGGCKLTVLSGVGCESFARHAGLYVQQWLKEQHALYELHKRATDVRCWLHSMECMEHENNSAIWIRE